MCQCSTEARPCGLADRLRSAWTAFRGPAAVEIPSIPWGTPEQEHMLAVVHAEHVLRNIEEGRPMCSQCESLVNPDEDKPLHEDWCWSCSNSWLEERIIGPMVDRIGRQATIRALKRLVSNVRAMT
jgi:hypothetical protein